MLRALLHYNQSSFHSLHLVNLLHFQFTNVHFNPFGIPGVYHNPGPLLPGVGPRPPAPFSHSASSQFQPVLSQPGPSYLTHPLPRPLPLLPRRRSTRTRPLIVSPSHSLSPPTTTSSSLPVSLPPPSPVVSSSCSSASNSNVPSPAIIEEVVTTTNENENIDFILIEDDDD